MEEEFKFTTVLKSTRAGKYVLDRICNGEIVCMRGQYVSNCYYIQWGELTLHVYRVTSDNHTNANPVYIRSRTQMRRLLRDLRSTAIVVASKRSDKSLVDIDYSLIDGLNLCAYIEVHSLETLKNKRDYDEFAPALSQGDIVKKDVLQKDVLKKDNREVVIHREKDKFPKDMVPREKEDSDEKSDEDIDEHSRENDSSEESQSDEKYENRFRFDH